MTALVVLKLQRVSKGEITHDIITEMQVWGHINLFGDRSDRRGLKEFPEKDANLFNHDRLKGSHFLVRYGTAYQLALDTMLRDVLHVEYIVKLR